MYFVLIVLQLPISKGLEGVPFFFFDTEGKNNYKENPLKQLP